MSYELKKPITEKQRVDFIVEHNGLKFEDTEMFLFALEADEIMGEKEIEIEVVDPETGETHTETITIPYPVKNPDYPEIELKKAKSAKIAENDKARDAALYQGVTYKNVLFDSDTDQKINLLAIVSTMDDEQTVVWFGKDNQPLTCSKEDLINIGGLITQLHSFCWNKNAEIKAAIAKAKTLTALNKITIDYILPADE